MFSAEAIFFVLIWLILAVGGRSRLFQDPGTFWHPRLGIMMLDSGTLVRGDPFGFGWAERSTEWIPHQWLGECLMGVIISWRQFDGLLFVTVTILAALYSWIASRLIRGGFHWAAAGTITGLTIAVGSSHFHVRPHIASLVFFAITCAYWIDLEHDRISPRRLLLLVPLYALWANLHGGFLGGIATMALTWLGWIVATLVRRPVPPLTLRQLLVLGCFIGVCAATAFANPYGWRLPATWIAIMQMPNLGEIIQEHAHLRLDSSDGLIVVVAGIGYALVLIAAPASRWRVTWLIPFIWLALSLDRIRHAPFFGIAAAIALPDVFAESRWVKWIASSGSDLFVAPAATMQVRQLPRRGQWAIPNTFLLITFGILWRYGGNDPRHPSLAQLELRQWPMEIAPSLRAFPEGTRVVNELNLGGFLIFFAPNLRIFIDDRCELYGDAALRWYDHAARLEPARLQEWAEEHDCRLVIALRHSPLDEWMAKDHEHWQVAAESEAARAFARRNRTQ